MRMLRRSDFAIDTTARRPLYILKPALIRVVGGRLLIEPLQDDSSASVPKKEVRQLPLARVVRIVADHRCQWSVSDLLTCVERGIAVHIVKPDGRTCAYCHGTRQQRSSLGELLMLLHEEPDGAQRLQRWIQDMRLREAQVTLLTHGWNASPEAVRNPVVTLANHWSKRWKRPIAIELRALRDFWTGEVASWLAEQIGNLDRNSPDLTLPDWLPAFAEILLPELIAVLLRQPEPPAQSANQRTAWIINAIEQHAPNRHGRLGQLLGALERWLNQIVG